MKHRQEIRARAAAVRCEIFPQSERNETLLDGEMILLRLEVMTGIERERARPNHPALQNSHAVINPDYFTLLYNGDLPDWFARFCQAHEYAHFFLHRGAAHCTGEDIHFNFAAESVPTGENRVAGYSSRERREREANLFARELLLPSDLLRRLFVEENWRARNFALATGLPIDFVRQQLSYALLIGDECGAAKEAQPEIDSTFALDDSQKRAAQTDKQRLLVEAGPGTGKTRALVGRILHLLETGVAPENILALTYSNRAAEEMRERIARFAPAAAGEIWLGTFHAFGLEILRKFAAESGLPPDFLLLDSIDAGILLEKNLLSLDLENYQSLHAPASNLKAIHAAILRAKDELADAGDYERAARKMLENAAGDDKKIRAAEKALEVAKVYGFYEKLLQENGWLDFGDLIFRAVRLLQTEDAVKGVLQNRFKHILVDEFQDVNRASGVLLRELAGDAGSLWAVGDARQTIYRWRGASDANLRLFERDYADAETISLAVNYRSATPIVELLNELAPSVAENGNFDGWSQARTDADKLQIRHVETPDFASEAEFIAAEIARQITAGKTFKDQAVLGRSNKILAKVADELTRRAIPVLYLGNMFERGEIRDLLSLLALSSRGRGRHLLRLTAAAEYDLTVADARRLIALAERAEIEFPAAFALAGRDAELSGGAKNSIELLQKQFQFITDETTAWQFLSAYLFDESEFLTRILRDETVGGRQKRLAIYQLLQFALAETEKSGALRIQSENPRKSFLRLVRHLAMSGEESAFRRLPAWAENIDAVRLLTVHAAKGLEFPVVFAPHLGNAYFPARRQAEKCPLPPDLLGEGGEKTDRQHEGEELCLFFVAVSRARENLILTRARNYGTASKSSRFLELMPATLPAPEFFGAAEIAAAPSDSMPIFQPNAGEDGRRYFNFYELRTFLACPRRYFYEHILNLRAAHEESLYLQFHSVVQETIRWAKTKRAAGATLETAAAFSVLDEVWQKKSLSAHAYAPLYRAEAEKLVRRAIEFLSAVEIDPAQDLQPRLEFKIGAATIRVTPDLLVVSSDKLRVTARRIKTGRAKTEAKELRDDEKLNLAALHLALAENFPAAEIEAAFDYLSGEKFAYNPNRISTQIAHLERAVTGIQNRAFAAKPSQDCPACAHYHICPNGDS